jgi:hypothetical protein
MFREAGMQVSLVTMSCPSPRTVTPPLCWILYPLDIKDWLKEDTDFLKGDFDWLPVPLPLAGVSPPEQFFALRTLYVGFRKAKLKKS